MTQSNGDVTVMLQHWREGNPAVLDQLMASVYRQLHNIAAGYMRRERDDHTLQPTALVSELYLRLLNQRKISWNDRSHFFTFSAHMMRNILADHARKHLAERRGGVGAVKLELTDDHAAFSTAPEQMLDLNRSLEKLEALDERKARLVELRFLLALTMEECADILKVSLATAERDLKFARSWLANDLRAHP